jgi:nuclear pore complex protein Nup107
MCCSFPDLQSSTEAFFTSSGLQQALNPLRQTADRVTLQMNAFAEKLERFKQHEQRSSTEVEVFQAAYDLIQNYQVFAKDRIRDLSKQASVRRAKGGWNNPLRENAPAGNQSDEVVQRLQLESETWELLLNLISVDEPSSRAYTKSSQNAAFRNLHRYSSDREIWEQFLDADQFAKECVVVMKWLENIAQSTPQSWDSLIIELEAQAERGEGLWAHGWLYTKEAIKGQKRLRSWPQPLDPNDSGIPLSLLGSDKQESLITQLDPDAITRQKLGLQKQDQFFERATWLTFWKMLRQGENWTKIRQFSQERLEGWRAVSLCGSSVDPETAGGRTPADDSTTRMANYHSQEAWRAACIALSHNPYTEDFEQAVYALLSGEIEPAYQVCQSWNDYIYVFYNHLLLARYRNFCVQLQRRLSQPAMAPLAFVPDPPQHLDVRNFLESVKLNERVGSEARNPYRTLQAVILSRNYDDFLDSTAYAIASRGPTSLVPRLPSTSVDDAALIVTGDQDALRILTHLAVIARSLGYTRSRTEFSDIASINVIAYIEALHQALVLDPIPLYVSLLPRSARESVLGRLLVEIVDPQHRLRQAKQIDKYPIDLTALLESQWQWVVTEARARDNPEQQLHVSRVVSDMKTGGRIMPVKKDFIGSTVSEWDERLICSLEWHRYLHADWITTCERGAILYRRFFGMTVCSLFIYSFLFYLLSQQRSGIKSKIGKLMNPLSIRHSRQPGGSTRVERAVSSVRCLDGIAWLRRNTALEHR